MLVATAAFLATFAAGPATALADTLFVAPDGEDVGDCKSSACATIQYAVDQAAEGDTVEVAAGQYEDRVTIDKPLSLIGEGADVTFLEGVDMPGDGSTDLEKKHTVEVVGTEDVTIRGFTLSNTATGAVEEQRLIVKVMDPTGTVVIEENVFAGQADPDHPESAVYLTHRQPHEAPQDDAPLIMDNEFYEVGVAVNLENPVSGAHVSGNDIHDLVFSDHRPNQATGVLAYAYERGEFDGRVEAPIEVMGNTFRDYAGKGVFTVGYPEGAGSGAITSVVVWDNRFALSADPGVPASGRALLFANELDDPEAVSFSRLEIERNRIVHVDGPNGRGIQLFGGGKAESGTSEPAISITGNRIEGASWGLYFARVPERALNPNGDQTRIAYNAIVGADIAVTNNLSGAIRVDENWWGCNEGVAPDSPCATFEGESAVEADTALQFLLKAESDRIFPPSERVGLEAALYDSSGVAIDGLLADDERVLFTTTAGKVNPAEVPAEDPAPYRSFFSGLKQGTATVTATLQHEGVEASTQISFDSAAAKCVADAKRAYKRAIKKANKLAKRANAVAKRARKARKKAGRVTKKVQRLDQRASKLRKQAKRVRTQAKRKRDRQLKRC